MGIYQQPHRSILTITVGEAALAASLLFAAYSLQVDNRTSQYIYLPDIQQYVFPYQTGVILPFGPSTNVRANFAPPPGIAQPAAIAGQVARIEAFDLALPPSPGILQSMDVNLTNGTLDATIAGGTIDATITNSQVNINDITPITPLKPASTSIVAAANNTVPLITGFPVNTLIRAWSISTTAPTGLIALYIGNAAGVTDTFWNSIVPTNETLTIVFAPGLGINMGTQSYIWIYTQTAGSVYYSLYYTS